MDTFSTMFKKQATNEKMKEAFKGLIAGHAYISIPDTLDASFSPMPSIKEIQGMQVLVVKGEYPTKPKKAQFDLKYVQEDGKWKLAEIAIDLSKS